jgi:hypothetical protein
MFSFAIYCHLLILRLFNNTVSTAHHEMRREEELVIAYVKTVSSIRIPGYLAKEHNLRVSLLSTLFPNICNLCSSLMVRDYVLSHTEQ